MYADKMYPGIVYHASVTYDCSEVEWALIVAELPESGKDYVYSERMINGDMVMTCEFDHEVNVRLGHWLVPVSVQVGDLGLDIDYFRIKDEIKTMLTVKSN
jgi:hypothetical protein